jgi:hypothetical protein
MYTCNNLRSLKFVKRNSAPSVLLTKEIIKLDVTDFYDGWFKTGG